MGEPRYDLSIRRYGALGLLEREEERPNLTRADVEKAVERTLDTMTPIDRAELVLYRRRNDA